MKSPRTLATLATLSFATLGAANANAELIITGIIDGGLSGGLPKAIELYATQDISDLSTYGVANATNGGAAFSSQTKFTGSASAGQFLYVASESTGFTSHFGFAPNFTSGALNINGDDVVGIFDGDALQDVYGVLGTDGTGQAWEHTDGWAYRNNGQGPNTTFTLGEWTFSGIDATDGTTNAAEAGFPVGTYAIPEPASLALLGLGGLVMIARRRSA